MVLTRRSLLAGFGAALNGSAQSPDLLGAATAHVRIAEAHRRGRQLWGRIGGSAAEHESARTFTDQLKPYVTSVGLERFAFRAHRPIRWSVTLDDGRQLESAFPAPFNARFPDIPVSGALDLVTPEAGWETVRGNWAFLPHAGTAGINVVREKLLYERAVQAGAAGLIFSIDTPPGRWRSVARIGKFWSIQDDRYPDGRRPIPCYVLDAEDGRLLENAANRRSPLTTTIQYEASDQLEAFNSVGFLKGQGNSATLVVNHLDGFFQGAHDNASGLATTIGIAARLSRIVQRKRKSDFYFVGLAAHHDAAAGMRAFVKAQPRRFGTIQTSLPHRTYRCCRHKRRSGRRMATAA